MERDITPSSGITKPEDKKPKNKWNLIFALILVVIAIAYDVSPIDIIPDFLPFIGWGDDFAITVTAVFNLIRQIRNRI